MGTHEIFLGGYTADDDRIASCFAPVLDTGDQIANPPYVLEHSDAHLARGDFEHPQFWDRRPRLFTPLKSCYERAGLSCEHRGSWVRQAT